MPDRIFAAEMIHAWSDAGWPVACELSGALVCRTSGLIVDRNETLFIVGDDDSVTMLPPALLSADRIESTEFEGGVVELRFRFPDAEVVLVDAEEGGSYAVQ